MDRFKRELLKVIHSFEDRVDRLIDRVTDSDIEKGYIQFHQLYHQIPT